MSGMHRHRCSDAWIAHLSARTAHLLLENLEACQHVENLLRAGDGKPAELRAVASRGIHGKIAGFRGAACGRPRTDRKLVSE